MYFNGTNGSKSYVSDDAAARVCTFVGDSHLTTDAYFGSSGTSLDGSVTIPFTPFMNFGTGAFTIEFYVRTIDIDQTESYKVIELQSAVNNYFRITYAFNFELPLSGIIFEACTPTGGVIASYSWIFTAAVTKSKTWYKIKVVRSLGGYMTCAIATPPDYLTDHWAAAGSAYCVPQDTIPSHQPITVATVMPVFTAPVTMSVGLVPAQYPSVTQYTRIDNLRIFSDTIDVTPPPPIDPDPEDPTPPLPPDSGGDPYQPPPTGGDIPTGGTEPSSTTMYFNIGSTRPIQGAYFYLSSVNTDPNAILGGLAAKYFDGQYWRFLTPADHSYVDGTLGLSQNGKVSWVPPHSLESSMPVFKTLEVQKYLEGYYLYWYHFKLPYGHATIAHVTLDIPFQNIIDTWDGNFQDIAACYLASNTKMDDSTLKVLKFDDYLESDASSYMTFADPDINKAMNFNPPSLTGDCVIVGFTERVTALYIAVPEKYSNIVTAQIRVDTYRDGGWHDEVNTISDGTSEGGASLSHSGVVSWKNMNDNLERKQSLYGSFPLYFYRLRWVNWNGSTYASGTLKYDDDHKGVRVTHISGIPVTNEVKGYAFSVHAADRLMLGCNNTMNMNELWISAQDRPEVFNGSDVQKIQFGNDAAIVCATNVYAQYASNIYNIILVFKEAETWILQWNQSSEGTSWSRFCISPNVGCVAPHTLCSASVSFENNVNQVKNIAIWRSHNGIYISNGQSPYCVSDDIAPVFDQNNALHVDNTRTLTEYSWVDEEKMEYHWVCACGICGSYRNDNEFVLDLREWKWFMIDRAYPSIGALNDIQCACTTIDIYGNKYNYGFNDYGYMERLEYGTDFDGIDITSIMRFGMIIPYDSVLLFSQVAMMNLICVPKTYDTSVTISHYLDGYQSMGVDSGTDYVLDMADSSHTVANIMQDVYSKPAIFHDFKFVQVSDESNKGFEPLYFSLYTQKVREHTR